MLSDSDSQINTSILNICNRLIINANLKVFFFLNVFYLKGEMLICFKYL